MKPAVTREQWLLDAIKIIGDEKFKPLGHKFNDIRVSVGFTDKKKAIGQWWIPQATTDNHSSIFLHPGHATPVEILGTLVHELVHDVVGVGHGPKFKKLALSVGLEGKMRATVSSKELEKYLETVVKRLGKFPHSRLKQSASPVKKQTTRMIKMECRQCGYICRAATTTIIDHGAVICPCNDEPMSVELPEE